MLTAMRELRSSRILIALAATLLLAAARPLGCGGEATTLGTRAAGGAPVPGAPNESLAEVVKAGLAIEDGDDYALCRWDLFPSVLILDMKSFEAQDRTFNRLAFFLEKGGYTGRLLDDGELSGLRGWNAHDYGPKGLARFFSAAEKRKFPLGAEELALRGLALESGLIVHDGALYAPGQGAMISISRESDRYARRLLLAHESYHGIFFTQPEYRAFCYSVWDGAEKAERRFMLRLLGYLGYDMGDRELVVNEFQAYLLQQPASQLEAYVRRMEPILAKNPAFVTAAADEALPGLLADERKLESFLRKRYRIGSGGA
jgi:hypothetical protein